MADGVGGGRFYRKIHGVAKGWPWGGHGVAEFSVGVAMVWPTGWTSATPAPPSTPKETSIVHSRQNFCRVVSGETSLTEYRHKMRSGDLPAYLSLNGPSNGNFMLLMLFCSILALMSSRWP